MERINVPFSEAYKLIQEGDVLLFRGIGWAARLIKIVGRGEYSHVAMATWRGEPHNSLLEMAEFKEHVGSRVVSLRRQVHLYPGRIDVFRPVSELKHQTLEFFNGKYEVVTKTYIYDGTKAANAMREMTGLPYGWHRLWLMSLAYVPFLRLFRETNFEDKSSNGKLYPVCSTSVAAAIRRNFIDPIPNLSDFDVIPSDLARTPILNYLLTIIEDVQECVKS